MRGGLPLGPSGAAASPTGRVNEVMMVAAGAVDIELENIFESRGTDERSSIAMRVGDVLCDADVTGSERKAAEALARKLVEDAVDLVRVELAKSVARAHRLPRDIAMRIAHDIDDVSCPFLQITEVFSDSDWQQLVLTISRAARIAVAQRETMSEALAVALAESGDSVVADTLAGNPALPVTGTVCYKLIDRFTSETWILDKLAEHVDLPETVAATLVGKVSSAMRAKLAMRYGVPEATDLPALEAGVAAMLKIISDTPSQRIPDLVERLRRDGRLSPGLMLEVLREGMLGFVEAAFSAISGLRIVQVRGMIANGGAGPVIKLLQQSRIPAELRDEFWDALVEARNGAR